MGNNNIEVSIIFVNYKTAEMTKNAIDSVISKSDGFSYEIIAVDNSDDAESWADIEKLKNDKVRVINAMSNLGFGKANNLGASIAKGKYLFFLNTDTLLLNNAVLELKSFLDSHPNVGIVGSNLYTSDFKPNHSYSLREKNLRSEKRRLSVFALAINKLKKKRRDFNYREGPLQIDGYVCGASLMIRKDAFDALGGFDKDIFMYSEEVLLCYRLIHQLNLKIFNVPSSKIVHFEGGSQNGYPSDHKIRTKIEGDYLYFLKAFGPDNAIKFIRFYYKKSSFLAFLQSILHNEEKRNYYLALKRQYKNKLSSIKRC